MSTQPVAVNDCTSTTCRVRSGGTANPSPRCASRKSGTCGRAPSAPGGPPWMGWPTHPRSAPARTEPRGNARACRRRGNPPPPRRIRHKGSPRSPATAGYRAASRGAGCRLSASRRFAFPWRVARSRQDSRGWSAHSGHRSLRGPPPALAAPREPPGGRPMVTFARFQSSPTPSKGSFC
jgi:hypothetical protein